MSQKNLVGERYAPGSDAAKSIGLSSKTKGKIMKNQIPAVQLNNGVLMPIIGHWGFQFLSCSSRARIAKSYTRIQDTL